MNRVQDALLVLYGASCGWLAYLATEYALYGRWWVAVLLTLSSAASLAAALREVARDADEPETFTGLGLVDDCCDTWWSTLGRHHTPGCNRNSP